MEISQFAPVLIPTLNRYEHFKRCVESLSRCVHAEKTNLFIALDYPFNDSNWDGYRKICDYVNVIKGFKNVTIIRRDVNYGAKNNIIEARNSIFKKYDRIIISEDDNEFSPNFLVYINNGLEKYESYDNVYAICGYNYPIKMPRSYKNDVYFYWGFYGWGYGMWRSKINLIDRNIENLRDFLRNERNVSKIKRITDFQYRLLQHIVRTGEDLGDVLVSYNLLKNNMYCVFPVKSKVRNWGCDGSGLHSRWNPIYSKQKIDDGKNKINFLDMVEENMQILQEIQKFESSKFYYRVKRKIQKVLSHFKSL